MRLPFLCAVLVAVGLASPGLAAPADASASTYMLVSRAFGDWGWQYTCTASALRHDDQRTYFLTAAHCILPHRAYGITPNYESTPEVARLESRSEDIDAAVLSINALLDGSPLGKDGAVGDEVRVVGWPFGFTKLLYVGHWAADPTDESGGLAILHLPGVQPGMSGAAVFCVEQRAVCGIVVGIFWDLPEFVLVEPVSGLARARWLHSQPDLELKE